MGCIKLDILESCICQHSVFQSITDKNGSITYCLVQENARLYDPLTGYFLRPDNYIAAPDISIGFNRYAYCLNNPLKYTDPDGEWLHLVIGAFMGGFANWAANGGKFTWEGLGYFGIGAVAGALTAGISSGISATLAGNTSSTIGQNFISGFIGTATHYGTGFSAGFVSGAASGFVGGTISGIGNSLIETPKGRGSDILLKGWDNAWKGAIGGAVLSRIMGGIDAVKNDRNFWTGAGKQDLVFALSETNGKTSYMADEKQHNRDIANGSKVAEKNSTTKLNNNNSTSFVDEDGLYHTTIRLPRNVNMATKTLKSNPDAGILKSSFWKKNIELISSNKVTSVTMYGWRYHHNPIRSVGDLFHYRKINL